MELFPTETGYLDRGGTAAMSEMFWPSIWSVTWAVKNAGSTDYVSAFLCLLLLAPGTLPGKEGVKTSSLVIGIS